MRTILYLAMALWLTGSGAMATAQTVTNENTRPLSLTDCFELALQNNLNLQIERINPEIALYNLSLAYSGYDPELSLSGRHNFSRGEGRFNEEGLPIPGLEVERDSFNTSLGGNLPTGLRYDLIGSATDTTGDIDEISGSTRIELRQPLLRNFWIDSTRLSIKANRVQLRSSEQGLRLQIMNILTSVETAYYDLLLAIENLKVQEKALQLADRLYQENRKRVEVGTMAPLDEKQAESEAATRRADLLAARRELDRQQNVLRRLLSEDYTLWHDVTILPSELLTAPPPMLNLQESWHRGMTQRPDLEQARLELERQGYQLKYSFNQLFPQLDVVGSYGRSAQDPSSGNYDGLFSDIRNETSPFFSYGAVLTIPLGNKAARERHKTAKAQQAQALLQLKKIEQDILVQIDDAIKLAQTSFERVGATKQAREFAEAALDAEEKKLANGRSTSFVVLQLQRDLTAARSAEVQALADYNKALAQLALFEGTTLEKHHIDFDVR